MSEATPDSEIPTFEGRTVADCVKAAAEHYGVPREAVVWKLDNSHFRTPDGRMRSMDTVKVFAKTRELPSSEGVDAAVAWVTQLLELMGLEGTVKGRANNDRQGEVLIDSPAARHLVGRRGATLRSIRRLLEAAMSAGEHGDWSIDLNVEGGRRREERDDRRGRDRDDREERRPRRDDRNDRNDRDERRPRRDDRDDRRSRGRDRDREGRRSDRDVDRLKSLARRLASKAVKSGETITMRKEMNSYERRVVHLELADFAGVETESTGDGTMKQIIIVPIRGGEE